MSDFQTRLERELVAAAGRPRRLRYARSPLLRRPRGPAVTPVLAMVIVVAVAVTVALRPVDRRAVPGDAGQAYSAVAAQVVGRSLNPFYQRLSIDKGTDDGIRRGDAVIDSRGLVGHVTEVRRSDAVVALLTDTTSVAPAITRSSRQAGGVVAAGMPGELLMSVDDVRRVRIGEAVATDGTPPGPIPIGRVESVVAGRIIIAPAADLDRVRSVEVLRVPATSRAVPWSPLGDDSARAPMIWLDARGGPR